MGDSDPHLLDRFVKQRDQAAFAALVERYAGLVLAACRRVLVDHHDAEEVAQATFLVLAQQAARLDHRSPLGSWLYGVALNLARNALRSRQRRERLQREAAAMAQHHQPREVFSGEIDAALASLPERERTSIILFHLEGRPVEEVADMVGRPVGTVCSWLSRGRDRLAKLLLRRGVVVSATVLTGSLGGLGASEVPVGFVTATATSATAFLAHTGAVTPAAILAGKGIKAMYLLHVVKTAIIAASLVVTLGTAGWIVAAESGGGAKKANAELGANGFLPTPDNAVGWRGDGSGRYPGATPPTEWYVRIKNLPPGLACAASKPKGAPAKVEALTDIALNDWIAIGPWTATSAKEALDTAYLADEATMEPSEGDKAGDKQWKKLPVQNGAVNLADVFGDAPLDPGQPAWDEPKHQKCIYAVTFVHAPSDGEVNLYLTIGPNRLFLNGEVVKHNEGGGQPQFVHLALKQGWNRLLLKSYGARRGPIGGSVEKSWAFSAWMLKPPKGPLEYETKNIAYQATLPKGGMGKSPGPIFVGDRMFMTGDHWLAAFRKQDGQLLWYRSIIAFDGQAEETKGDAALVEQYNAACKKVHALDEQYPAAFKDGKLSPALEGQYKQLTDELVGLLPKLDGKRTEKMRTHAWGQCEPGWAMTPCSDGNVVCAWDQDAIAACYDLDGKFLWTKTVENGAGHEHGFATSPVIVDGKFVGAQKDICAFDIKTGAVIWTQPSHYSWGSLIRAKAGNEAVVVEQGNVARSSKDGKLFRDDKGSADAGVNCCPTSIPIEGSLVFGCFGRLDLFDLNAGQHNKISWPESAICGGEYADSTIPSPVYHDGYVYIFTTGGGLVIVDLKARKTVPGEHLDTRISWGGRVGASASPSFAGGHLYFFDDSGNAIIREPGPNGKMVARNSIYTGPTGNGPVYEPTNSTPVFDESRIYWRLANRLICIGEK